MNIAWQRFHAAALDLARSGTVKERLQRAYRQHLADLDASSLPPQLRAQFLTMTRSLTRERPMRGEDALAATIRKLSCAESDELASALIEMFGLLSRLQEDDLADAAPLATTATQPAATGAAAGRVIPLFAEARP